MLYHKFSDFLKSQYGQKVYKLPVNVPSTCPNRDGTISSKGCIFCGEEGAGFELLSNSLSVKEQLHKNMEYIRQKYHSNKFIAYFQNYSNTYMPLEKFKGYILDSLIEDVVALYISTRPDCVSDEQIDFLRQIQSEKKVDILLELGLQTINEKTLQILNRGHNLSAFSQTTKKLKSAGLSVCAHYITDLPWDNEKDVIKGAQYLSELNIDQVKLHSLYVLENTELGEMYKNNAFLPLSLEEFIERTILFLEYLSPTIIVQRLIGRAPEERTFFCNWGKSWWKIQELITEEMIFRKTYQGIKNPQKNCDY